MTEFKVLSEIIGDIYEAAYRPGMWEVVIEKIVSFSKSKSGALFIQDKYIKEANGFYAFGLNEEVLHAYAKHSSHDPAFKIMQTKDVGIAVNIHGPDQHEIESSEYFNNVREKYDIGHVGGANVLVSDKQHVGLGLHRSANDSSYDEKALSLITEFIPHLQRAFKIQREFIQLRLENIAQSNCLDSILIGVILLDENGTPVYTNLVAKSMIDEHPALRQQANGFRLSKANDEAKLFEAIQTCIKNTKQKSFNACEMMSLSHPDRKSPLIMMIKPLNPEDSSSTPDVDPGYVGIYITDPENCLQLDTAFLEVLFNFSPAETRLAIALTNGMSLSELSDSSNKNIETLRTQLKSLFRKTDTRSQAELVQVLLKRSVLQSASLKSIE